MDKARREVLRRKRPIIADVLDFGTNSQKEYRQLGLLLDEMLPEIKVERSEFGRVFKWLELLPMRGPDAFDCLASLLKTRGHSWIANEMYADLDYENGTIHVEEYVFRESGMLVHKIWGKSKRISEVEKREIQRLISSRYQTAKEGYKRQIEEIQRQLEDVSNIKWSENGRMKDLVMKVHAYLRVEHDRLEGAVLELEEALDIIQGQIEEKGQNKNSGKSKDDLETDYYEVFLHVMDGILELLSKILYEKEESKNERQRCIEILSHEFGIKEEKPVFHIDAMIQDTIIKYKQLLTQAEKEFVVSDKLAQSAEERLYQIKEATDRSLAEKEEHIIKLESEVLEKTAQISDLKKQEQGLVEEKDNWLYEADKWKKRAEQFERTRRIGYYPGHYDKMYYDVNSVTAKRKPNPKWQKHDREVQGRAEDPFYKAASLDSFSYRMMLEDDEETARRFYISKYRTSEQNLSKKKKNKKEPENKRDVISVSDSRASVDLGSSSAGSTLTPPLEHGKYLVEQRTQDQPDMTYTHSKTQKKTTSKYPSEVLLESSHTFIREESRKIKIKSSENKSMDRSESFYWDDSYKTQDGVLLRGEIKQFKTKSSIKLNKSSNEDDIRIKENGNHIDSSNKNMNNSSKNYKNLMTESRKSKHMLRQTTTVTNGIKIKDKPGSNTQCNKSTSNATTSTRTSSAKKSESKTSEVSKPVVPDHGQDSPYHSDIFCLICNPKVV